MESKVIEEITKTKFPRLLLGIETGVIIMALKQKSEMTVEGVVVGGNSYPIGEYSDGWNLATFKDFMGSVTLSND